MPMREYTDPCSALMHRVNRQEMLIACEQEMLFCMSNVRDSCLCAQVLR